MKIVAGVGENKNIVEAARQVEFPVILVDSEEEFTELILKGEADAFVRGSLEASIVMAEIKNKYGNIYRAAFLEVDGNKFFLAPVGIDEGDLLSQKIQIIKLATELLPKMGMDPKIAVLSGGRANDVGRSKKIDESIAQGESLTRITRNKYIVKHYYILIENAIADHANFILAPDGISGNLIFRSLILLGSGKSHGAITLGISEILVDTSRSQSVEGYIMALKFAKYLADLRNNE
ncbi:MAG: methanogenesis marker protein Mmp4/MtxX [Methanobacterium sp.]|jgi:putative methanogen marker protein 4